MNRNIGLDKVTRHLEWFKTKIYLDSNAVRASGRVVKRGEVYKCNLGQGIGSEECKERPCVIIQNNAGLRSSNTIVAPITHSNSSLPIVVSIENKYDSNDNLILDGNVLLGDIRCISKARLGDKITTLDALEMKEIDKAISISLDIKHYYDTKNNTLEDKLKYIDILKKRISDLEHEVQEKDDKLAYFEETIGMIAIDSEKKFDENI
ncbi:type II toxin-antitoxin system PemK/MazF family toxin [Clostridioides difficile]